MVIKMHGQTTQETRQFFIDCWQKYQQKQPLQALEEQIVDVLLQHPEYESIINNGSINTSYFATLGETNPFLHMGLHLTLRDQIITDKPTGIRAIYQHLLNTYHDPHIVEHLMIEPLAECLWQSQQQGCPPNENNYLKACRALGSVKK